MASRDVAAHLRACCGAIYEVFGEAAPTLSDDAAVIRAHELSRAFGERALQLREWNPDLDDEPLAIIELVLRGALERDATGALSLLAMVSLVGPRLLISVHDARVAVSDDPALGACFDELANTLVQQIRRTAQALGAMDVDEVEWLAWVQDWSISLEESGNGESFGLFA